MKFELDLAYYKYVDMSELRQLDENMKEVYENTVSVYKKQFGVHIVEVKEKETQPYQEGGLYGRTYINKSTKESMWILMDLMYLRQETQPLMSIHSFDEKGNQIELLGFNRDDKKWIVINES